MSLVAEFKEMEFNLTNYESFVKRALENNERFEGEEIILVSEKCSAIFKQEVNLPKKLNDPGRCTFPYNEGNEHFQRSLCDLGSWISLMLTCVTISCVIFKDLQPTSISIHLVDKSVVKLKGIIEDVLGQVDKFINPVGFIVMDMERDQNIPLIFGRPFLAAGHVFIVIKERTMTFYMNEEEVMFDVESVPHY